MAPHAKCHNSPYPYPLFQFQCHSPSPCIHCHALQLAWLASCWAVYHLQRQLSTRISHSPFALFTCRSCLALSTFYFLSLSLPFCLTLCLTLCLSNCHPSSLRTSWHWELFLRGIQILLQFVNSLLACFLCFFAAISRHFMPHFRG